MAALLKMFFSGEVKYPLIVEQVPFVPFEKCTIENKFVKNLKDECFEVVGLG